MAAAVSANETAILIICDVILVVIFVIGVIANSLVLLVFYRKPGLRTVSNRFVINLVATNLCACIVELPLVLLDNILGPTAEPRSWLCSANEGITAAVCSASVLAVLLIALDQYWAVVDPLRYHARIGAARSAGMLISAWVIAVIFGISGGINLTSGPKPSLWYSCGSSPDVTSSSDLYSILFAAIFSTCVFVLPFGAILWIYVCIYTAAHRNSQRTRRRGSAATVSNVERQYHPISEGQNDVESPSRSTASRRDKVILHRSHTFVGGDSTIRKSSDGDLSFVAPTTEVTVPCVNSEVLDSNKASDRKCSFEIPDSVIDDKEPVDSGADVSLTDNSVKKSIVVSQSDVSDISQRTPLTAKFYVGPPESEIKHESQTALIVSEDNVVNSELLITNPPSQQSTPAFIKHFPICVISPILKQTHDSDILTSVQPSEDLPKSATPDNKIYIETFVTPPTPLADDITEVRVVSPLDSFLPLTKGFPHSNSMPTVTITPPQTASGRTSLSQNSSLRSSGNIVTSLRSRISNASLFRYREEMRAARISALVIIMALVNWLPYCALSLLYSNIFKVSLSIPHYVNALGLVSLSSGALISPCLFAYRNRKLQREVKKILGFPRQKKEDGSSRREDQCKGENNLSSEVVRKNSKRSPLTNRRDGLEKSKRKCWGWRGWKQDVSPDSSYIESNLLQHNTGSLDVETGKEAGLLLSCMKGSRWVRQEGVCDLNILQSTALHTSVDTCRSSFSSGGSTNSTQCTTSSLETTLDN